MGRFGNLKKVFLITPFKANLIVVGMSYYVFLNVLEKQWVRAALMAILHANIV